MAPRPARAGADGLTRGPHGSLRAHGQGPVPRPGYPDAGGPCLPQPGGGGRRGPLPRRLGGRQGPGAGRRSRQGWRRRALPVTGGRRRRGRAHAPRRVQGQPGGPRPGRGVAADLGGVLHLDRARSEHRGLPRHDDRRRRGGHRDARPRASGGDPACPDRPAARPSHLPPPPAHRSAAGSGARRGGRRRSEAVRPAVEA